MPRGKSGRGIERNHPLRGNRDRLPTSVVSRTLTVDRVIKLMSPLANTTAY
ncbi:hypothetical protein [Phormidium sp. CCY1219]|uniref:hypothetical protein n=1 Tax=Phormidium sp. CCY1219 TaxID=2886104 RepID=UPI002D1EA35F|nr:hypothetical protein [Phormidium sp. CCY1219]MEB3830797.1 hypothetical protein [Phormidium sp. CCY1219]